MSEKRRGKGRPRSPDRHKPFKNLRVPEPLYNRLKAIADANDREVAREGRRALTSHVEAEENRLGITPPEED